MKIKVYNIKNRKDAVDRLYELLGEKIQLPKRVEYNTITYFYNKQADKGVVTLSGERIGKTSFGNKYREQWHI